MPDLIFHAVVLAAGRGKRMGSERAKVLQELCGRPMLHYLLDAVSDARPAGTVVVVGHGREEVERSISGRSGVQVVEQAEPLGTGHAVAVAEAALGGKAELVLVVYGDTPLVRGETMRDLVADCPADGLAFLAGELAEPFSYGRVVRDAAGLFVEIREEKDLSTAQRGIREVNLGAYAFRSARLFAELRALLAAPREGEYYLTDVVGRVASAGGAVAVRRPSNPEEGLGVNTPRDLARVRRVLQDRILARHMGRGVTIVDPATTYVDWDVEIGEGTVIHPFTVLRRGVRIGERCEVGPFAHLRGETVLREGAQVGNFTEVKKSLLGAGAKAKHLSYLGDAEIGAGANVGAGTITANWDGRSKHRSTVEEGAFLGVGTVLIAPAAVGKGARTGAGSVVTRGTRIPEGETWVGVPARPLAARRPSAAEPRGERKETDAARRGA